MTTLFSPIREFFKKGDVLLLFLCLTASGYGLALIYSATRYLDNNNRNVIVQAVAICIGVVIYIVLTFVDFQLFVEKCWKWLVAFDVGFILLLLTPLGKESGGNRNWLALDRIIPHFPLDLQPNEIVKIPFILLLAWQAARIHQQERDISSPFSVAQLTGHTLLMVGLIAVVCGDIGMCVIYLFLFVTISWMAGVKARWFALGGTCFVGAILGAWFTILQSDRFAYIRNRFMVVLDHSLDPLGAGFQQSRSLLAIGSGQLTGQGYLNGTQTQASYSAALPARQTDFIFSVCGEELGMLVVSQFTLYADTSSRRPGFTGAARPDLAVPLYERFMEQCRRRGFQVEHGTFGADMQVASVNDGPVTILFDTDKNGAGRA